MQGAFSVRARRYLTSGEENWLRTLFGNSVDYNKVRLKKGLLLTARGSAVTINNTISFSIDSYYEDFSLSESIGPLGLLAHELTHVWQYQNQVRGYWWMKAALEHVRHGRYVYEYKLDRRKSLEEYRFEQQAQIVQDYVYAKDIADLREPIFEEIIYNSIKL